MNVVVATAVGWFLDIFRICMFVRAILSWFPGGRDNFISNFLAAFTEPVISPIRKLIRRSPLGGGMIDFSFIIVILLITLVRAPLVSLALSLLI